MANFYKLVKGTIEIDGVRMHQTSGTTPQAAAQLKARLLRIRPGFRVLDVCTGLGYSALAAARAGAHVTTIEADAKVLELARQNPDSSGLFGNPKIKIVVGDALQEIRKFGDEFFDAVEHDPPRFSHASELYSLQFYKELYRVLKDGAPLFHYTGKPGERSGKNYRKGIKARLVEAGFWPVEWVEGAQGFLANKRRKAARG